MFFFEGDPANPTIPAATEIVKLAAVAILSAATGAFFPWLAGRRKTGTEVEKNESEIIQGYVKIVAQLMADVDKLITDLRAVRIEVKVAEDAKAEADDLIEDVRRGEAIKIRDLHRAFVVEKETLGKSVGKMIKIVDAVTEKLSECPNNHELRREAVRLKEMLYYVRNRLIEA